MCILCRNRKASGQTGPSLLVALQGWHKKTRWPMVYFRPLTRTVEILLFVPGTRTIMLHLTGEVTTTRYNGSAMKAPSPTYDLPWTPTRAVTILHIVLVYRCRPVTAQKRSQYDKAMTRPHVRWWWQQSRACQGCQRLDMAPQ